MNSLLRVMKPRPSAVGSSTPMAVSWSVTSAAPFKITIRHMSKHLSKSATKRLPLSTKRAGKGYYKGKGATTEGHINSTGKFILNPQKRLELVVPDLEGFQLKPYIARSVSKFPPEIRRA